MMFTPYQQMRIVAVKAYLAGEITLGEMHRKLADIELEQERKERENENNSRD